MYINPFVAGVLATIFAELVIAGIAIAVAVVRVYHNDN